MSKVAEKASVRIGVAIDGLRDADAHLLTILRRQGPMTRAALVAESGLSRSTIVDRLGVLLDRRLIERVGNAASTGGRPADMFGLSPDGGVVVVADVRATSVRTAALDLSCRVIADEHRPLDVPPSSTAEIFAGVLPAIDDMVHRMDAAAHALYGIGIGIPSHLFELSTSAVERSGSADDGTAAALCTWLSDRFGCPAIVDDRVNAMAVGERVLANEKSDLIFIDVDATLGAGVISGGVVYRGASGAAGDIGHIYLASYGDLPCACGQFGCANVAASAAAACAMLGGGVGGDLGIDDLLARARRADANAADAIRRAGRALGEVVAILVSCFDPRSVVLGGRLSAAAAPLLAGVRETLYRRGASRSSRDLRIGVSADRDGVGLLGLAELSLDTALRADRGVLNLTSRSGDPEIN